MNIDANGIFWYPVCFILFEKERKTLYYKNEIKKNCYEKENDRLLS